MFFSKVVLGIFATVLAVVVNGQTDYCSLCSNHIGCNNNGKLSSICPPGTQVIDLAPFKDYILKLHNEYRNKVASGAAGFPAASKMPALKWHSELQYLAELNVKTCTGKHDSCRKTTEFPWSGQNLAMQGTTATLTSSMHQSLIKAMIDGWYNEIKNCQLSYLQSYPESTPAVIGHFTAMIQDRSRYIGCGAITRPETIGGTVYNTMRIACNYEFTNLIGTPVYVMGARSCPAHSVYTSLCA